MNRSVIAAAALLALPSALSASPAQKIAGRIERVTYDRGNVFDPRIPGEDIWLFRAANRIHIKTLERVVEHENLLPPGSTWDPIHALETERNIRSLGFIRDAEVRPTPTASGGVDLNIRTQDAWTLRPTLGVGTEGGDNSFSLGVEENNLLGMGKTVGALHSQKGSERRKEARYIDPRV